jgi:MFS family permease
MDLDVAIPALTAVLAGVFALLLLDQWRSRRRGYQLIWALGMTFYALAVGCEAVAAAVGWSEPIYQLWYLTGAVWTAGWLGLGTAFLLGRTRFGLGFALCLFLAGLFTFLTARRNPEVYADAGTVAMLYFLVAGVLALAVAVETYFQNWRWPWMALAAVAGATLLSLLLMALTTLPPPGYSLDPATGVPTAEILPPQLRLLTPFLNVTGAFSLILGALFSAYVFMPKRRILPYSLDPGQPGDQFLFNLLIAPIAITVNFLASLPGATGALLHGRVNSRVPATLLIALGAFIPALTDSLNRFGSTEWYQLGKLLGAVLLLAGFLVSTETFGEIRVPFTSIVLRGPRTEPREATER